MTTEDLDEEGCQHCK